MVIVCLDCFSAIAHSVRVSNAKLIHAHRIYYHACVNFLKILEKRRFIRHSAKILIQNDVSPPTAYAISGETSIFCRFRRRRRLSHRSLLSIYPAYSAAGASGSAAGSSSSVSALGASGAAAAAAPFERRERRVVLPFFSSLPLSMFSL